MDISETWSDRGHSSSTDKAAEVDLEKQGFPITKTMGVVWIAEDKFSFWFSQPLV